MHMAKGTIVALFTVFSAYISSVQCREATSGNRVEEAGVHLGGGGGAGVTKYKYVYIYIYAYTYTRIHTLTLNKFKASAMFPNSAANSRNPEFFQPRSLCTMRPGTPCSSRKKGLDFGFRRLWFTAYGVKGLRGQIVKAFRRHSTSILRRTCNQCSAPPSLTRRTRS